VVGRTNIEVFFLLLDHFKLPDIITDHISGQVEQSIGCMCVCLSVRHTVCLSVILIFGTLVQLDPIQVTFDCQGHGSKFMVAEEKRCYVVRQVSLTWSNDGLMEKQSKSTVFIQVKLSTGVGHLTTDALGPIDGWPIEYLIHWKPVVGGYGSPLLFRGRSQSGGSRKRACFSRFPVKYDALTTSH